MDLGYSNDMINSTTGRMTTDTLGDFFFVCTFLSYGLGIMLEKVGGIFFNVGVAGGVHFPWEIIFLMTS